MYTTRYSQNICLLLSHPILNCNSLTHTKATQASPLATSKEGQTSTPKDTTYDYSGFNRPVLNLRLLEVSQELPAALPSVEDCSKIYDVAGLAIAYFYRLLFPTIQQVGSRIFRSNRSMSAQVMDVHPLAKLEQQQCFIASVIVKRNKRDPRGNNVDGTRDIDLQLQKASAIMPSRWWAIPKPVVGDDFFEVNWESSRTIAQLIHYFLLIELHLPFLLSASEERYTAGSKIACTNASRDVLSRFISVRGINHGHGIPRALDFFALVAAMALMLAHIGAHRRCNPDDPLGHQRQTDRALTGEALENMRASSSSSKEILPQNGADVLRQLLDIEAKAAGGLHFSTSPVDTQLNVENIHGNDSLSLDIPFYGRIIISPAAAVIDESRERTLQSTNGGNHDDEALASDKENCILDAISANACTRAAFPSR